MHLLSTQLSSYGVKAFGYTVFQWCSSPCKDLQRNLPIYLSRFKKSEAQEKVQDSQDLWKQRFLEISGRLHTLELDNNQIEDCIDILSDVKDVCGLGLQKSFWSCGSG